MSKALVSSSVAFAQLVEVISLARCVASSTSRRSKNAVNSVTVLRYSALAGTASLGHITFTNESQKLSCVLSKCDFARDSHFASRLILEPLLAIFLVVAPAAAPASRSLQLSTAAMSVVSCSFISVCLRGLGVVLPHAEEELVTN